MARSCVGLPVASATPSSLCCVTLFPVGRLPKRVTHATYIRSRKRRVPLNKKQVEDIEEEVLRRRARSSPAGVPTCSSRKRRIHSSDSPATPCTTSAARLCPSWQGGGRTVHDRRDRRLPRRLADPGRTRRSIGRRPSLGRLPTVLVTRWCRQDTEVPGGDSRVRPRAHPPTGGRDRGRTLATKGRRAALRSSIISKHEEGLHLNTFQRWSTK